MLLIPVLLSALLASGCGDPEKTLRIGRPVPDLTLTGPGGESVPFPASVPGRVLLIHFWADWCPLCIDELRNSKSLAERYRQQGLRVVAINLEQTPEQVGELLGRLDLNYPVLFDREGLAARRYGVTGLPTSYLVDRERRLHRRIVGAMAPPQLERLVQEML